jgi:acetolactate synthase I/II/III large subunit
MKGYEFIAKAWIALGVKDIFLVPTNLYDSLVQLEGSGVRRILTHGEKAAAYMADAYAQVTGRPSVVVAQGGPGATNLAAGLADAYQGSVPVITFTTAISPSITYKNRYQFVESSFEKVTKFEALIATTARLPDLMAQAWREATSGDPRPVHLLMPAEVEAGEADLPEPSFDSRYLRFPAIRIEPEPAAVSEAVAMLERAQRPVIVVGAGAMKSGAWPEVQELAERMQIPVASTIGGKGAISDDHPLAVGIVGSYARRCANEIVAAADLVLVIGTRTGGMSTNQWTIPAKGTQLIHITIDPREPGRNYPRTLPLVADAKTALTRMLAQVTTRREPTSWVAETRERVARWRTAKEPMLSSNQTPIRPERLCREISRTLPPDGVVVADTGYAAAWSGAFIDLTPAGRRFIRCEGSLGWALPAAIGVKAALPNQPVVAFMGDGGFWYHIAELETALRYGISPVFVVLNNHALAFDTHILDFRFQSRGYELAEFLDVDLAMVARAIGCEGERITDPADLGEALERAYRSKKPTVLDVVIDHDAVGPVTNFDALGRAERRIPDDSGDTVGVAPIKEPVRV